MFRSLRPLAPAVLLLTSLSGWAATGALLAHVAREHAAALDHAHHHHGHHDDHGEQDRGPAHSHELAPTTPAAPVRFAGNSAIGPEHFPVAGSELLVSLTRRAANPESFRSPRAGPLRDQRSPILLI